jgi:hypothetical protein
VADQYFRDESSTEGAERRLPLNAALEKEILKGPRVKGSQELPLTRRPGMRRKPGNFFFRRGGERGRDYHEHPYWFGMGTTKAHL